jgi:hypothetical protein
MKKIAISLPLAALLAAVPVMAHCPLCTLGAGAAAMGAKSLGMDSTIIGLFIGAFGVSTGLWLGKKIKKEYFKFQLWAIAIASFLLTVIPMMKIGGDMDVIVIPMRLFGDIGTMFNKVYWINKILFGSIFGGLMVGIAPYLSSKMTELRKGKFIPFQGVALTLVTLGIIAVIFQLVI